MKLLTLIVVGLVHTAIAETSCYGLTTERDLTPKYVTSHAGEFSIKVSEEKNGLIGFELKHNVPRPMYHVAHLVVVANGRVVAETSTPTFGKMQDNTFYFSIARDLLAESTFDLSDGALVGSGEDATPVPGTTIYRVRPIDFVPRKLLNSTGK